MTDKAIELTAHTAGTLWANAVLTNKQLLLRGSPSDNLVSRIRQMNEVELDEMKAAVWVFFHHEGSMVTDGVQQHANNWFQDVEQASVIRLISEPRAFLLGVLGVPMRDE